MLKTAIILAGGFGTRLQSVLKDLPKPMAPINDEPFLTYQLQFLKYFGFQTIVLSVGHLAPAIKTYFKNSYKGMQILYAIENEPMGTGGGLRLALEQCDDASVIVLNGDSFFDIDLSEFQQLHLETHSRISLALRKVLDVSRYGSIQLSANHSILSFSEKNTAGKAGLINGGIYILDRNLFLENTKSNTRFSLEQDFFEKQITNLEIKGFEFDGYFIDIGVPEDYQKAQHDLKEFRYK